MEYRKLGKTNLQVSSLSYGASSLGSVFHSIDESEGLRTVHEALDLGINYIDVSPYYGLTKAETVLGKAIRQIPRDRFILSTKAGRYGVDTFDFSAERIKQSLEESLQRLNTDYADILYLHDIEFAPFDVILEEGVPTLQRLKEQGKIRYYGISALPLAAFRKVLHHTDVDVLLSYCHYSLNDTALLDLLPLVESKGIGLVNASPLSMGLLTHRGVPDWHLAGEDLKNACKHAAAWCKQQGVDISRLAIQFTLQNHRIPTTLVSTANPENIRKNVQWMDEPIDQDVLDHVLELLKPAHNLTWPSGLPEYNKGEDTTK